MADDPVTLGELGRRIDALSVALNTGITGLQDQLRAIQQQAAADRAHNADTFARKDVLASTLSGIDNKIVEANKDIDTINKRLSEQEAAKRQLWLGMAGTVFAVVVAVLAQALGLHPGG